MISWKYCVVRNIPMLGNKYQQRLETFLKNDNSSMWGTFVKYSDDTRSIEEFLDAVVEFLNKR